MSKRVSFQQFPRRGSEKKNLMENKREKEVIQKQRVHLGQLQNIQDQLLHDISTNMGRVMGQLDEEGSDGEESLYQSCDNAADLVHSGSAGEVVRLATQSPEHVELPKSHSESPYSILRKTLRDESYSASPYHTASPCPRHSASAGSPHHTDSPCHTTPSPHRTPSQDPMQTLIDNASRQMQTLQGYIYPQNPPQTLKYAWNEKNQHRPSYSDSALAGAKTTPPPPPPVTPQRTSRKTSAIKSKSPLPRARTPPPGSQHHPSPQPVPQAQETTGRAADGTMSHDDTAFRASLLEKHAKHIEDLRKYYETEIASLMEKLGSKSVVPGKSSGPPQEDTSTGILLAKLESVESDNKRLKTKCSSLEGQLDSSMK